MTKLRKLILISNDDGYQARGLHSLIGMVRKYGDIVVVAPDSGRSGASMSISSSTPVRNKLIKEEKGSDAEGSLTIWSCSGTPDDCVKMAFENLCPRTPDLVLGGINHGDNCAVNAHYSGTVSIAFEACIKQVPAIAFSSGYTSADADFGGMTPWVEKLVEHALTKGLPKGTCLNVNCGAYEEFKGVKICRMGMGDWKEEWQKSIHPHGWEYYWIAGYYAPTDGNDEATDTWAFKNQYVAVTPLQLDLTAYEALKELEKDFSPNPSFLDGE